MFMFYTAILILYPFADTKNKKQTKTKQKHQKKNTYRRATVLLISEGSFTSLFSLASLGYVVRADLMKAFQIIFILFANMVIQSIDTLLQGKCFSVVF